MKVGIIGAGFTGLAAAATLIKAGHQVIIWEADAAAGGLAIGFRDKSWAWPLEKHYHHIFTSDTAIQNFSSPTAIPFHFSRPQTSTLTPTGIYQLDSPSSLLRFPDLSLFDRVRTGASLAFMRYNPFWKPFEHLTAERYLRTTQGDRAYSVLWEPLLTGKFGGFAPDISAAWFWARIKKRSSKLGYPEGGFQTLAHVLAHTLQEQGVTFCYSSPVTAIKPAGKKLTVQLPEKADIVDRVICTLSANLLIRLMPTLPSDYLAQVTALRGIGAVNLVLALKQPLLPHHIYWLNINKKLPFLAVVEHTNFIDPAHYGGDHLVYVGNYLPHSHPYFSTSTTDLIAEFTPGLRQINPQFKSQWIRRSWVWKAQFAQPIVTRHYSRKLLPFTTPVPGLYLANIQQVYPWDRGTNYAVDLGQKVGRLVASS